jgi:hypothetical protein
MGGVNLYIFHELSPFDEITEVNCVYFDLLCAKYLTFVICCRVSTYISTISTYISTSTYTYTVISIKSIVVRPM